MTEFAGHLYALTLDAAPFLLFGLVLAGLMKAWLPEAALRRHLGGDSAGTVVKAALAGAPMPLCSCGVLPVAMNLRRGGASRGSTISFLVATPETGIDSVSITYALLGPVMAVVRPLAAVASAVTAGLLAGRERPVSTPQPAAESGGSCCSEQPANAARPSALEGIRYALTRLLDDIVLWLLVGLVFAAAVRTYVPPSWLAEWGQGPLAMVVMAAVGVPMYICASASTPIAAGLLLAGVSPGTVLVFLLAGPATNIATMGLVRRELGGRALTGYLSGVIGMSVLIGTLFDAGLQHFGVNIVADMTQAHELLPESISLAATAVLVLCAIRPLRSRLPLLAAPADANRA